MKYYVFFNLVNGRDIRITQTMDDDLKEAEVQDRVANNLVGAAPFLHFYENDKLIIINMANVAYIRVTKAE